MTPSWQECRRRNRRRIQSRRTEGEVNLEEGGMSAPMRDRRCDGNAIAHTIDCDREQDVV